MFKEYPGNLIFQNIYSWTDVLFWFSPWLDSDSFRVAWLGFDNMKQHMQILCCTICLIYTVQYTIPKFTTRMTWPSLTAAAVLWNSLLRNRRGKVRAWISIMPLEDHMGSAALKGEMDEFGTCLGNLARTLTRSVAGNVSLRGWEQLCAGVCDSCCAILNPRREAEMD